MSQFRLLHLRKRGKKKTTSLSTVAEKKVLSTEPVSRGARGITVRPHCGHGLAKYITDVNTEREGSQGRKHNRSASVL